MKMSCMVAGATQSYDKSTFGLGTSRTMVVTGPSGMALGDTHTCQHSVAWPGRAAPVAPMTPSSPVVPDSSHTLCPRLP